MAILLGSTKAGKLGAWPPKCPVWQGSQDGVAVGKDLTGQWLYPQILHHGPGREMSHLMFHPLEASGEHLGFNFSKSMQRSPETSGPQPRGAAPPENIKTILHRPFHQRVARGNKIERLMQTPFLASQAITRNSHIW